MNRNLQRPGVCTGSSFWWKMLSVARIMLLDVLEKYVYPGKHHIICMPEFDMVALWVSMIAYFTYLTVLCSRSLIR